MDKHIKKTMLGASISLILLYLSFWPVAYASSGSSKIGKAMKSVNKGEQFPTEVQDYGSILDDKDSIELVDELISEIISVYKSSITDENLSVLRDAVAGNDSSILLDSDVKSMGKLDLVQGKHEHESAMSDLNMKFTLETMEELLLELIEDYSVAMDDEILNAMTRKLKLLSLINREALSTAIDGDVKAISFDVDPQDLQLINDLQGRVNDLQDRAKDLQDRFERDAEPEPNEYEFESFEREAAPVGYGSGYVQRESAPEKLTKRIHEAEDFDAEAEDFDAEAEPERNGYEFDRFEGEPGSE